ncbi:MAG TPA: hypothetical protein PLA90_05040 [Candidatus Sumerlaeota bacterium]|nr:hypothetical protein [Candidatus Sumerlaeota bacterium]HPS00888.1 hypothetical protein [Candidatus Sumerlaeota bacterium]
MMELRKYRTTSLIGTLGIFIFGWNDGRRGSGGSGGSGGRLGSLSSMVLNPLPQKNLL